MQETQNYLNSILSKRLNSVTNPNPSNSKLDHYKSKRQNFTRVPVVQQKINQMPTVFKKRGDSLYNPASQFNQFRQTEQFSPSIVEAQTNQQKKISQNSQRVQYMLITKRIVQRQQQQDMMPQPQTNQILESQEQQEQQINASFIQQIQLRGKEKNLLQCKTDKKQKINVEQYFELVQKKAEIGELIEIQKRKSEKVQKGEIQYGKVQMKTIGQRNRKKIFSKPS